MKETDFQVKLETSTINFFVKGICFAKKVSKFKGENEEFTDILLCIYLYLMKVCIPDRKKT